MDIINEINISLVATAPFITALVLGVTELIKRVAGTNHRWIPLVSVLVGAIAGGSFLGISVVGVTVGIVCGLAATGVWEFGKTTVANQ